MFMGFTCFEICHVSTASFGNLENFGSLGSLKSLEAPILLHVSSRMHDRGKDHVYVGFSVESLG